MGKKNRSSHGIRRMGLCKGCPPPPKVEQRAKTPEISDGKGRRGSRLPCGLLAIFQGRTAAKLPGGVCCLNPKDPCRYVLRIRESSPIQSCCFLDGMFRPSILRFFFFFGGVWRILREIWKYHMSINFPNFII